MTFIPNYLIIGTLRREFILTPANQLEVDLPGGDLLYAAAGTALWSRRIGLVGLVGEDYPREVLRALETTGLDTRGIQVLPGNVDLRWFRAYDASGKILPVTPMSELANRGLRYPKQLLGYNPHQKPPFLSPEQIQRMPEDYWQARAAHICPLHPALQNYLVGLCKQGSVQTISLMLPGEAATPGNLDRLRTLANTVTALIIREEHLRQVFFQQTRNLPEMLQMLYTTSGEFIIVLRALQGALLYDMARKKIYEIAGYPLRLLDPTGYEDAFGGGWLAGFRQSYDGLEATLIGLATASISAEGSGPFYLLESLPGLARARADFLRTQVKEI